MTAETSNAEARELLDVSRAFLAYQTEALHQVVGSDRYAFVAGWEACLRGLTDAGLITWKVPT